MYILYFSPSPSLPQMHVVPMKEYYLCGPSNTVSVQLFSINELYEMRYKSLFYYYYPQCHLGQLIFCLQCFKHFQ